MSAKSKKFQLCFPDGHCIRGLHADDALKMFASHLRQGQMCYVQEQVLEDNDADG